MLSPDQLERRNYFHNALCQHTVKIRKALAKDAYGTVTSWSASTDHMARVEDVSKLVQGANGQMQMAGGKITFAIPAPVLDTDDEISVPTVDVNKFPSGYKKIGKVIDLKQDPTGQGSQATVLYY